MTQFSVDNQTKIAEIEAYLSKHPYLSDSNLPGLSDAKIYHSLTNVPDKKLYPNFHFWYRFIRQFSLEAIKSWEAREVKVEQEKSGYIAEEDSREETSYHNSPGKGGFSDVFFQIKPTNDDFDLEKLALNIQSIHQIGLNWQTQYKLVPIAYGSSKLELRCSVLEEKISIDRVLEMIQQVEGVQSAALYNPSFIESEDL